MSFVYDLADINYKTEIFYQSGSWIKPQGITMVSITAIGAGGGGGGGTTNPVASSRSGGGGGGSGGITRLIIPEMFISDSLIISVGTGGAGGVAGGGLGGSGLPTFVDQQTNGNGDIFTRVITASGGSGSNSVAPGAGATAAAVGDAIYSTIGIWMALAGVSGAGGSTTDGTSVTYASTGLPITGGGGGGGMLGGVTATTKGGDITGAGFVSTNPGLNGVKGNKGVYSLTPFYATGGSGGGGGGTTPNSGGEGGHGNIGCGGGGGGGGTSPTGVGGVGGKGGDGLVIIQCW